MKSLNNLTDKQALLERLGHVAPDSARRWGRMNAHQMVCHLNDSFKVAMGETTVSTAGNLITTTLVKWIALRAPMRWPKGAKTRPEIDQQAGGGTRPIEFNRDIGELRELIERFTAEKGTDGWPPHPVFGRMSAWEWQRWGYLHVDHHLRQFGT